MTLVGRGLDAAAVRDAAERVAPHVRRTPTEHSAPLTALAREFSGTGVTWNDPEGGFYFWVKLPHGLDSGRLLQLALEEGVAFVPGHAFTVDADHSRALRFSISAPSPARIDEGVRRLRRAFDRLSA